MPYPIQEFWKLASESQLFAPEECQRLAGTFAQIRGAMETGNAFTLSEWLVTQRVLTRYQAKVLLARRPGPFIYGDYKVQDRIESGRLQGLFRAIHVPTRQPVCLAFLSGPQLQDPQALLRVKQALTAAAAVKHPHVARLYHFVDLDAYKFAVLPDLQGRAVDEFLSARGPFPAAEACRLARQAALGLAELHKSGQMHGEVRPANLWLDPTNNLKLLHLPVSRDPLAAPTTAAAGAASITALQTAADYLAPELAAPNRWPATPLSDLYALGCTLYHMLVGRPPFAGGDVAARLRRHAQEQPPLANQANPQVPQPIAQVVAYLLAKDPGGRYQQALHVAEALAPYVDPSARAPIVEPVSSATRAYEEWLARQQPSPARPGPQLIPMPPDRSPPQPAPAAMPAMAAPVIAAPRMAAPLATAVTATLTPPMQQAFIAQATPAELSASLPRTNLASQRKEKRQQEHRNKLIIGTTVGLLTVIIAFLVYSSSKKPQSEIAQQPDTKQAPNAPSAASSTTKPSEPAATPPAPTGPPEEPLTSIDGQPLWESPTVGEPLDLRYLPGTAKMFLALRPAEIWAHSEGQQVLDSLGIKELVGQHLMRLSGTSPNNLEQAVLGFSGRGMGQTPAVWLVARAKSSIEEETLKQNWNTSEAIQIDGKTLYKGEGRTFYAPAEAQNKLFVSAPLTDEKELAAWLAASKNPPLLDRHLEGLLRWTDRNRHVTLLASPKFLFNEGRTAMVGTLSGLVDPVQSFLMNERGESPGAALFSLHLSDSLFLELRASEDSDAAALAKLYRSRVQGFQDAVEQHISTLSVSPYSLKIMLRYPGFFGFLSDHTRAGTSDRQAVLRTVMPPVAASNLAFGTHLAMLEAGSSYAVAATPQTPEGPTTITDRLKQKYTLTFDRDALDRTMALISQDTGIPIKIEGGDLLLEGITQNQSFGLDEKDKPIVEILKTILKKANPDGKLIYVIQKRQGQETVVITTRAAAAKRGDAIPAELK